MLQPWPVLEPGRPVDSRGARSKGHGTFCGPLEGKDLQGASYTGSRTYRRLATRGIGSTRG